MDLAFATLGFGLLAAVLTVAGPLIRLTSPGPVFYRQRRVGRNGRPFTLFKLRTMVDEAEPEGPVWAAEDDPRVTAVGRWLRRSRLDELPQVINLARGEMSVVGPRPERPAFVAALAARIPFYRARHAVRPGMTGWATIHQGYARSLDDALVKLQYDLYYIKHQSVALDLYILVRTVAAVVRGSGGWGRGAWVGRPAAADVGPRGRIVDPDAYASMAAGSRTSTSRSTAWMVEYRLPCLTGLVR